MGALKKLLRWLDEPIAYRGLLLTDIKRFVEDFLLQLGPGSVLLLERETKPGFLQLAMTERRDQWRSVEFGLPDDEWSTRVFDPVHAALASAGYNTHVETNDGNRRIPRFLRVHVEGNYHDLTLTLMQVLEIAANRLEFGVTDRYTLRMLGQIDPEHTRELAAKLEQLPRRSSFNSALAKYARRLGNRKL